MDQQLFLLIHNLAGKSRLLDFLGIFFAEYFGYFLIILALAAIFSLDGWKKKMYYLAFFSLTTVLSRGIITETIRFFYHRPRPFLVLDFTPLIEEINKGAFPSGHAAFYFALALPVFLINKKWGWYFMGGAFLMGLARIFVGVHWPLDILGGFFTAFLSMRLINLLLNKFPT